LYAFLVSPRIVTYLAHYYVLDFTTITIPGDLCKFLIMYEGKMKLSLCLIKHHAMKTYGGIEVASPVL